MPAPPSPSSGACSWISTWWPAFIRHDAAERPPIPAPAIRIRYVVIAKEVVRDFLLPTPSNHGAAAGKQNFSALSQPESKSRGDAEMKPHDLAQSLPTKLGA